MLVGIAEYHAGGWPAEMQDATSAANAEGDARA